MTTYTFIFKITYRENGRFTTPEYRVKTALSIPMARVYARRISNMQNVKKCEIFKQMY